jgi:hypothetical protein
MLATDISASSCLSNWVGGVASTGNFVKHPDMNSLPTGVSGIPEGWTVEDDGEESGGSSLTFPVTLVEGDNGELGIKFYNYVKNGQYTDNDTVYFDWKGFLMQHWDWGLTADGNVYSMRWEVIDEYNPQGSPYHEAVILYEDGELIII